MAAISLSDFRSISGISVTDMPDAQVIRLLGAATSMAYGITGAIYGGIVEGLANSGADTIVTCYDHGLLASGKVFIGGSGNTTLDGVHNFQRIVVITSG